MIVKIIVMVLGNYVSLIFQYTKSAADRVHGARRSDKARSVDLVPEPFAAHRFPDHGGNPGIRSPPAEQTLHIGFFQREQTIAELAIAGQSDSIAIQTKRT